MAKQESIKPKVRLYVADDFRTESTGKVTAVGLFPDRIVVVGNEKKTVAPSLQSPHAVDALAFMFTLTGLEGKHKVAIQFHDGVMSGVAPPEAREVEFIKGRSASFPLIIRGLTYTSLGRKKLSVIIDGERYDKEYELRAMPEMVPAPSA